MRSRAEFEEWIDAYERTWRTAGTEALAGLFTDAVEYADGNRYRDLWIARFAPDGRCREFEEWPYWPGQPVAPPTGPG